MTYPQPQPAGPPTPATSNAYLFPPVGLVVSGLLGLIGGTSPWVTISMSFGPGSSSMSGGSGDDAWVPVLLGAFILVCAAIYLFGVRRSRLPLAAAGVLALGLFGFGLWKIIDLYGQSNDVFSQLNTVLGGGSVPDPGPGVQLPNLSDLFQVYPGPGLWMIGAAGLVGAVLAALGLWSPRLRPGAPVRGRPFPPPGPGQLWPTPVEPPQAHPVRTAPVPPYPAQPAPAAQWARPEPPAAAPPPPVEPAAAPAQPDPMWHVPAQAADPAPDNRPPDAAPSP